MTLWEVTLGQKQMEEEMDGNKGKSRRGGNVWCRPEEGWVKDNEITPPGKLKIRKAGVSKNDTFQW